MEIVVLLNSIVSFALVATLCYWAWSTMPAPDNRHAGWLALALGLWDAGLAWVLQVVRVRRLYARDLEKRLADKRLTKDGKTVIPGTQ